MTIDAPRAKVWDAPVQPGPASGAVQRRADRRWPGAGRPLPGRSLHAGCAERPLWHGRLRPGRRGCLPRLRAPRRPV